MILGILADRQMRESLYMRLSQANLRIPRIDRLDILGCPC